MRKTVDVAASALSKGIANFELLLPMSSFGSTHQAVTSPNHQGKHLKLMLAILQLQDTHDIDVSGTAVMMLARGPSYSWKLVLDHPDTRLARMQNQCNLFAMSVRA